MTALPALIRTCSIWRSLDVVGDTPVLLILEASWLGARRFEALRSRTGLLKALLSDRLKRLVATGVLERRAYSIAPPRFEYVLTDQGRDLYWTALMLLRWEQRWGGGAGKIALTLTHRKCGRPFVPEPACGHCGGMIDATAVEWAEGPGVGRMVPTYSRRRHQRGAAGEATSLFDQAAHLMGDRWASLILRSIFTGINRYEDIRQDSAIATNILSDRLKWLEGIGVIRQRADADHPHRREYRLTRKGMDYYPALLMLLRWGDRYHASTEGPPVVLRHKPCGHTLDPQVVCSECRAPIRPAEVAFAITERAAA